MRARDDGPPDDEGERDGAGDEVAGGAGNGDAGGPLAAPPGPDTLADAVAVTRSVAAARVELTTAIDGPAGPVVLAHRAAFVDGGLRASAESDLSQVARALGAAGQELEGDWTHPARVVIDGGTVFSQLGPMAEALGHAPDEWSSAELADLVGSGAVADNDTLALALDPLGPLDQLLRPAAAVTEVADDRGDRDPDEVASGDGDPGDGAGRIRGVPVHHLQASLELTGGGAVPAEGSFEARLVAVGVDALPVDVWLDDGGVIRRLEVSVDAGGGLTTTFEVYDVGEVTEADVAPPRPSEVIDPTAPS